TVVDVEGRDPCQVRAQHALEVLGTVEHVDAEVVLTRFVVLELGALAMAAEAARVGGVGEPPGALGDLRVGQATPGGADGSEVGVACGGALLGESEIHGWGACPESAAARKGRRAAAGVRRRARLRNGGP